MAGYPRTREHVPGFRRLAAQGYGPRGGLEVDGDLWGGVYPAPERKTRPEVAFRLPCENPPWTRADKPTSPLPRGIPDLASGVFSP
jgi:hypothetical protein